MRCISFAIYYTLCSVARIVSFKLIFLVNNILILRTSILSSKRRKILGKISIAKLRHIRIKESS